MSTNADLTISQVAKIRGQKGDGLLGPTEEVASDQAERLEEMLLHPRSGGMVT